MKFFKKGVGRFTNVSLGTCNASWVVEEHPLVYHLSGIKITYREVYISTPENQCLNLASYHLSPYILFILSEVVEKH